MYYWQSLLQDVFDGDMRDELEELYRNESGLSDEFKMKLMEKLTNALIASNMEVTNYNYAATVIKNQ